jgi:hypothetical protein
MVGIKCYTEHLRLFWAMLSAKEKVILCSRCSQPPKTNPTDFIFSGIFVAAPS